MNSLKPSILTRSIAALLAIGAVQHQAGAVSGDWMSTTGGGWGTATNWSSNPAVPGSTAGDVININSNIGAAASIALDANRTVGSLLLGDADSTHAFTLTGNTLILDQTAVAPALVRFGVSGSTAAIANTIASAIQLNDNARLYTTLSSGQVLSGTISGAFSMTFDNDDGTTLAGPASGQGQFFVNNTAANTYSLGTTIDDVRVQIQGNNAALGTGAVNILDGGQMYMATALTAVANTFNIAGNGWAEATAGQPFGALRLDSGAVVTGAVNMTANAAIGSNSGTGTVNGVISGTGFTLTKRGAGILVLGGANTYSGGLSVAGTGAAAAGFVQLNNNAAAGTGTITYAAGATGRVAINGGVTIANNFDLSGTGLGFNARGLIEQIGTGVATVNGTITIGAGSTLGGGGHFVGGLAVGNELALNGAINSAGITPVQREGRVIYRGGGTYTNLTTTNYVGVGANNGIASGANLVMTNNGAGTLDLGAFNQTLGNINIAGGGAGTITSTTGVLTLNGALSSSLNFTHSINGNVDLNAGTRTFTVNDGTNAVDLQTGAVFTNGTITKAGAGTMTMNGISTVNVTVNAGTLGGTGTIGGALTVNAGGTLTAATLNSVGTLTSSSLTFGTGATTVRLDAGTSADLIATGPLVTNGTTTFNLNQLGGILANGTYNLITYTGTSPGLTGFALVPMGHATAGLQDTGTAIAVQVTGNDKVIWDGTASTAWTTAATGNWKLATPLTATDFITGDDVIFQDAPVTSTVDIAAAVTPSNVAFTNTVATTYTVTGAAGITGTTALTKTGNGTVVLRTQNDYSGATTVSEGTLELDHDATGNQVLTATSGVSVASGATLRITRDGTATAATTTFNRSLSGTGNVDVNLRTGAVGAVADSLLLTGANTGFTGTLRLLSPATGTYRLLTPTPAQLGNGSIEVQSGAQLYLAAQTYNNSITIAGTGYADSAGNIGAMRFDPNAIWAGPIVVNGSARIGAHNNTIATAGVVSGSISGGDLTVNATNFNNSYNLIFTGSNSYGATIIGGQNIQTTGVPSMRLNIGNGGTTGTLGAGNVTIHGDGANGVLGFDRSNGYTLLPGQTITASNGAGTIANSIARTFIDFDTLGAGFNDNGNAITLGGTTAATGGQFRIGQTRAGAIASFSGALTGGTFLVGSGQGSATANLNSGAVVNVGTARIALAGANTTSILNINSGSSFTAFSLGLGEVSGGIATVNQAAGTTVNIDAQLRVGHFANNTSVYNMTGGTLTMTGASPNLTPSTAGAGAANATGDNNINALATPALVGGGIYIGNDGTGVFNHTGGTVTTNWIVLDNRTDSGAGLNMPDGFDRYNLSGAGSVLALRSTWGLLQRGTTSAVSFGGGTVRVDNTGTGGPVGNTGANITIPLDATIDTVASTTTNLDTNGAGNGFTLMRDVRGTGTLNLTGGGTINLNGVNFQNVAASITGTASLSKIGTAMTTLSGSGAGYTGAVTVAAGQLDLPSDTTPASITIADGAVLGGEPTTGTLTLGGTVRTDIVFNPNTAGALTTTSLLDNTGNNNLAFSQVPTGAGPWTAINYTSRTGTGGFFFSGAAGYRVAPVVTDTGTAITVNVTGTKALTWSGAGGATWDQNTTVSWLDTTPAADTFFSGDTVTFDDTAAVPTAVSIASGVSPWKTTVNSSTNNFTLTSAGAGISGIGNLEKFGSSTLTLAGTNTYLGKTVIGGGVVSISAVNPLGLGNVGNSIELSGGGRLNYTGTTAIDLGINRHIAVGTGGGILSHSGTTAVTMTIPGNLSGSGALTFRTAGTSGTISTVTTYALTGLNAGFTGDITVEATGNILSTLNLPNQNAVPNATSITVTHPAASVTTGNANTLNLAGVTLPAGTTLNMTGNLNGAISQRSQVTSGGTSTINGPINLTGDGGAVLQFSPGTGTLTLNGNIAEATPGSFGVAGTPATLFFRGAGNTIINGTINLPNANVSRVDNTGITTINSTGNNWNITDVRSASTLRIGVNDALDTGAVLLIGQATDAGNSFFDLNGFNQEVAGLNYIAGNGANTRGIINNGATQSTLTINNTGNFVFGNGGGANPAGNITGNIAIVKNGTGSQTLAGAINTYTGNVTVNAGTLVAGGNQNSTALGSPTTAGRTVTVNNSGSILSFTTNNVFGNGVGNANLPSTILNAGTTLTSTRYNVLGPVTLNGATLTQSATDAGSSEGFQFRGTVTVGGAAASTISTGNGKPNHLGPNTTFDVADATGDALADLIVSAPLRNQSGDFALAAGALTKTGAGTMSLTAANTFTGGVTITAGTLNVNADAALGAAAGHVMISGDAVLQASGTVTTAARTLTLGPPGGGTIDTNGHRVNFNAGSTITGQRPLTKIGTGVLTLAGTQTYPGLIVDAGDVNLDSALGTGTSTVEVDGRMNISVDQTLASLTIGAGGIVTLGGPAFAPEGAPAPDGGVDFGAGVEGGAFVDPAGALGGDAGVAAVPEPGAMGLLLAGALGLLSRRRRCASY